MTEMPVMPTQYLKERVAHVPIGREALGFVGTDSGETGVQVIEEQRR